MSEQVEPISAAWRISHYSTLGVDEHATQAQIRDAYRRAVQRCHPDRFQGIPEAEAAFKEITAAYKVLRDPRSRRDYDRRLGLVHARRDSVDEAPELRSQGEVDDRDLQRFESIADGHARRGLDAPGIASHLIADQIMGRAPEIRADDLGPSRYTNGSAAPRAGRAGRLGPVRPGLATR